jgi:hypothetical protein
MEMEAAILWGLTPFGFWQRPDIERAHMLAHYREARLRKAHAQHVENAVMEKKSKTKSSPSGGPSEHDRFFGSGM